MKFRAIRASSYPRRCHSRLYASAIADIADRHGLWLHVDAAYGGPAALLEEHRHILDGSSHADSIVINPHKWLFTPVDLSILYTRRPEIMRRAFSLDETPAQWSGFIRQNADYYRTRE